MSNFEDAVVEHVLERLLVEIDRGQSAQVYYTQYNNDGSSSTQLREVNVQSSIVSSIMQRVTSDEKYIDSLHRKIEWRLESDEFVNAVADRASATLVGWLDKETGWGSNKGFPNRDSFKKRLETEMIKQIAKMKADAFIAEQATANTSTEDKE